MKSIYEDIDRIKRIGDINAMEKYVESCVKKFDFLKACSKKRLDRQCLTVEERKAIREYVLNYTEATQISDKVMATVLEIASYQLIEAVVVLGEMRQKQI